MRWLAATNDLQAVWLSTDSAWEMRFLRTVILPRWEQRYVSLEEHGE